MTSYNLIFSESDLLTLDRALQEQPFRLVAPLIAKINEQIREQESKKLTDYGEVTIGTGNVTAQ